MFTYSLVAIIFILQTRSLKNVKQNHVSVSGAKVKSTVES